MKTTVAKTTPELHEGDVVFDSGARILLVKELVRRPCCEGWDRAHPHHDVPMGHCHPDDGHGELVSLLGVITNADDPDVDLYLLGLARGERTHRERNGRWCPEGDDLLWTIQGNAMATWGVEA